MTGNGGKEAREAESAVGFSPTTMMYPSEIFFHLFLALLHYIGKEAIKDTGKEWSESQEQDPMAGRDEGR